MRFQTKASILILGPTLLGAMVGVISLRWLPPELKNAVTLLIGIAVIFLLQLGQSKLEELTCNPSDFQNESDRIELRRKIVAAGAIGLLSVVVFVLGCLSAFADGVPLGISVVCFTATIAGVTALVLLDRSMRSICCAQAGGSAG